MPIISINQQTLQAQTSNVRSRALGVESGAGSLWNRVAGANRGLNGSGMVTHEEAATMIRNGVRMTGGAANRLQAFIRNAGQTMGQVDETNAQNTRGGDR